MVLVVAVTFFCKIVYEEKTTEGYDAGKEAIEDLCQELKSNKINGFS